MNKFIIYPAIDLRAGKVVRLMQGDPDQQTTYGDDPAKIAQVWANAGAPWLHVVNLDGAFNEDSAPNLTALGSILQVCGNRPKIQFGGGMRSLDGIEKILSSGVSRVVIGTAALENPGFSEKVLRTFGPQKIAFALDAFNGELMTRGWRQGSGLSIMDFAQTLADHGAQTLIYTNIHKDGMETGVDWEIARQLAEITGLDVIASGGVVKLEDVRNVRVSQLGGVIIGRALYENNFTLQEALEC